MTTDRDWERMDDREIDLKDLLLRICMQWRKFLAFMLAGAVLAGGAAAIGSQREAYEAEKYAQMSWEEYEQIQTEKLEKVNSKLSEQEIAETGVAFQNYQDALEAYDVAMEYTMESVKMHLNASAVPTLHFTYYVDNHYETRYPVIEKTDHTKAVSSALAGAATGDDMCSRVSERLGWDVENNYISELVSAETEEGILSIDIIAPTRENCETIRDVISEIMKEKADSLRGIFGDFELVLLEEHFETCLDADLQKEQETCAANLSSAKEACANAGSSLSAKEKESFDIQTEIFEARNNYNSGKLPEVPGPDYFQPKYMVLGAFAGLLLYGMWMVFGYCLSGKLHVADELEYRYGVDVLAVADKKSETAGIGKNGKKKWFVWIDRLILQIFGYANALDEKKAGELAVSEIRAALRAQGMKKVYFVSTVKTESCSTMQKRMCEMLGDEWNAACNERTIIESPKELEMLAEYDGVVLVEECNVSEDEDIRRIVTFCRRNEIPVIGSIVAAR